MSDTDYTLHYPEFETNLKTAIDNLNNRWKNYLISIAGDNILSDIFVTDGFYPYYSEQKIKLLFIGKESLEIGGANYQDFLYRAYIENKIGSKTLNAHKFHSTMLYIAYALEKQIYDWKSIPYADGVY